MQRFVCGLVLLCLLVRGGGQAKADYLFTTLDGVAATGINDSGDIVGSYVLGSYLYSGGSYTPINVPTSLALPLTGARGINNARQIVGYYDDADGVHGFLLNGGTYTRIDVPGSVRTFAYGLNNAAQLVGTYQIGSDTGPQLGFLLSGGNFNTIRVPGASLTTLTGINDHSQVVGTYRTGEFTNIEGFLLSQGESTAIHSPGSRDTLPFGVNNAGHIVGWYDDGTTTHGFLLSDGIYSSIDFPGSTATSILGINNFDQIVGLYLDATGIQHAFLASPVPEPSTLFALIVGTTFLLCWSRQWKAGTDPGPGRRSLPPMSVMSYGDWLAPMLNVPPESGKLIPKKSCAGRPSTPAQ
jgi:hypothetical protein